MPRPPVPLSWIVTLALLAPARAQCQASPYLPTDDPRMPLIEQLIARGDVRDPSPLERPFRKGDVVAALRASTSPIARRLALELSPAADRGWGEIAVKAGVQAYTQGRRDLLQDGGDGNLGAYGELRFELTEGSVFAAGRTSVDTRRPDDPDLPREDFLSGTRKTVRINELYLGLQSHWGELFIGQLARTWGPAGIPGVPISDAAYPRPELGARLGRGAVQLSSIATRLHDAPQSSRQRYYVAHRLAVRFGNNLTIAAWEVGIIAGTADQLDGTTRAVVPLLVIPALLASRNHRNEMVGGDISWRPSPRFRLEAQLAIDDWNFDANNPYPQRWAGSATASGALGATASWRVGYTTASSLAFRTLNPDENIVDQGIGIGRLFPDNELIDLSVGLPLRDTWLVTPRLALLRQGEGRIESRFPTFAEAAAVPARFIGVTANTVWAGVALAGGYHRLQLSGEGGVRHTGNADHFPNRSRTTVEGRVIATLGFTLWKGNR